MYNSLNLRIILKLRGDFFLAEYKTHQREEIIGFLSAHSDVPYGIDELVLKLGEEYGEKAPGKSTVYRLIAKLVEDGTVKRFEKGNSRQSVYQIAGGEECHHHLHMKCLNCGKLLHMEHEQSEELIRLIYGDSDFTVDREQTTLFGCCRECKQAGV